MYRPPFAIFAAILPRWFSASCSVGKSWKLLMRLKAASTFERKDTFTMSPRTAGGGSPCFLKRRLQ
jgi:hypothetical protein